MRRATATIALIMFVTLAGFSGSGERFVAAPMAIDNILPQPRIEHRVPPLLKSAAITWTIIDSMPNPFGTGSRGVKPMAFDPATNSVVVVYRGHLGYATSVGQLWYSVSRDAGNTWRRVSELNAGTPTRSRYPSAIISNPTNSTDSNQTLFVYTAPQVLVSGSGFGDILYGVDITGGGSPFAVADEAFGQYWSNLPIWAANGTPDHQIFWVCYTGTTQSDFMLWRTSDFVSINQSVPPTWNNTNFQAGARRDIWGAYRNGRSYYSIYGNFLSPDPNEVYNIGYSMSTNNGATWGGWNYQQPDWRSTPGLGMNYDLWIYGGPGNFSQDMLVDANDRVHLFEVVYDTLTLERSVVEIYETGSGWSSKIIQPDLKESTNLLYGTLNQMGNHMQASISQDGAVMSLVWLDAATQGDSIPDIWFSARHINGNWSAPENLTQTPNLGELMLHASTTLKTNGGNSYTAFLGRTYEIGISSYPPNENNPAYFYFGTHTFTVAPASVGGGSGQLPLSHSLGQNYPNPFNPSTEIRFMLAQGTDVKLTVSNVLGEEVASLLSGYKEAGSHSIIFNAASLSSGVYFYTLKAGRFVETKKMLLVR